MEIKELKTKLSIDINDKTFISDNGEAYGLSISDIKYIKSRMHDMVLNLIADKKNECERQDIIFEYENFIVDESKMKLYDESNLDTYKHFVYNYFNNFYNKVFVKKKHYQPPTITNNRTYNPLDKSHLIIDDKYSISIKDKLEKFLSFYSNIDNEDLYIYDTFFINESNFLKFFNLAIKSKMFALDSLIVSTDYYQYGRNSTKDTFPKTSVACCLLNYCIENDDELLFNQLLSSGLKSEFLFKSGNWSYIYNFILKIKEHNYWYYEKNADSIHFSNSKTKIESYFKWLNIITVKFPKLKIHVSGRLARYINDNNDEGKYKRFLDLETLHTFFIEFKKEVFESITSNFSDDFVKNNCIQFNDDIKFAKESIDKLTNEHSNDDDILHKKCKFINSDAIFFQIGKVQIGGYVNNNQFEKRYASKELIIRKCTITTDLRECSRTATNFPKNVDNETYLVLEIYKEYTGKRRTDSDSIYKHFIKLSKFHKNPESLNKICKKWLNGVKMKEDVIDLIINEDKKEVLDRVSEIEQELKELKKLL